MRYGHLLLLVAGCGFRASPESGDPAAPADGPGAVPDGGVAGMLRFDTADDFGAIGAVLHDMTIEARGSLTPGAYSYGGLMARGYNQKLWTQTNPTWAALDGKLPAGSGMWHGERITDQSGFLDNLSFLGITDVKQMSIALEGEVWLVAGSTEKFLLSGDDLAFFQIAPPGTTEFGAVSGVGGILVPVATPATGWYPIRVGTTNNGGSNNLDFTHSDDGGAQLSWTRDRMRAPTSALTGTLQTVFGRQILGGGQSLGQEEVQPISRFETGDLVTTTFTPQPQGAGTDDWSARYAGQLYVAQPGTYTLTITSDSGNLGLLGRMRGGGNWGRDEATATTSAITADLDAGWNDLCVDYNHVSGGKTLHVQISGPEFSNVEVPADHLRPVESQDDRLAFGSNDTALTIPDHGAPDSPATALLGVDGSDGETVASIDVTFQIDAKAGDQIRADLETPAGKHVTIRDVTPGTPNGQQLLQVSVPPDATGMLGTLLRGPVKGTWKLLVFDTSSADPTGASTLESVRLTLHTTGGPEKIARSASWTSPVLEQPTDVFAIDGITTDERVPGGATLSVFVRTCQQADCSDGAWTGPVAKGAAFAVTPGRHLQLRVDMTSNGVLEPELRSLAVAFRRAP
ncbi:MAG TPA: hypothetical protein VFT22_29015 [Kofleriaceae bacterium]|nr:hypothetical protein [Kofleriaceae bacterium]